jgi:hypothetical protein
VCGCVENTALSAQGFKVMKHLFDWSYAPDRKGLLICSACGPTHYRDGSPTNFGKWHGEFNRDYLPLGEFITNDHGNLEHERSGLSPEQFMRKYPDCCGQLGVVGEA